MAEYIDREKLLRDIEHYHLSDGKFQHWVEVQLAADVAPVVHGRWEKHTIAGEDFFGNPVLKIWACNCSVCGMDGREETPYCPNCGAKMDEEVAE